MSKAREPLAWLTIAALLEERHGCFAYDPTPQPSLCECVGRLRRMGVITSRTYCTMRMRVHLFAPYLDTTHRARFWNRYYKAAREQRILAAYFLHHMSKGGTSTIMNTTPQIAFKLDLETLDRLRAALLRDYQTLRTRCLQHDATRAERVHYEKDEQAALKETDKLLAQQHFECEDLLRFFSVPAEQVTAAGARAAQQVPAARKA